MGNAIQLPCIIVTLSIRCEWETRLLSEGAGREVLVERFGIAARELVGFEDVSEAKSLIEAVAWMFGGRGVRAGAFGRSSCRAVRRF